MWRDLFSGGPAMALAVAALLFFVAVFGGALVWVMNRKRTEYYQRMARLPVERDPEET